MFTTHFHNGNITTRNRVPSLGIEYALRRIERFFLGKSGLGRALRRLIARLRVTAARQYLPVGGDSEEGDTF